MIDAWDVYWVMQLDSIGIGLIFFGIAFVVASSAMFAYVAEEHQRVSAWGVIFGLVGFGMWGLNMFLPSSKTAAAMMVLPAITSESVVQTVAPETRELYELAKDALRSVAKDKPAKEAEAK